MKSTIIPVNGTEYQGYIESRVMVIPGETIATQRTTLKAMEPPRGADGAIAMLVTFAAEGTLSSAAVTPTVDVFFWRDAENSDENGTTIFLPGLDATLADTFTVPTADGTTTATLTVNSNKRFTVGDTVYVTGVGYYEVTALTGTTVITVVNNAATGNSNAGVTAASGVWATIVPATGPRAGRWMQASALT